MKARVSFAGTTGTKLLIELEEVSFQEAHDAWDRLLALLCDAVFIRMHYPELKPIADALDEFLNGAK